VPSLSLANKSCEREGVCKTSKRLKGPVTWKDYKKHSLSEARGTSSDPGPSDGERATNKIGGVSESWRAKENEGECPMGA